MGCSNSLEIEESQNDKIKADKETPKKLIENGVEDESEHSKDKIYKKNKFTSNEIDPIINSNKYTETKSPILNKNEAEKMKVPSKKKTKKKKEKL